jgi:hypothetical protein
MADPKSESKFVAHPLLALVQWLEKAAFPKPGAGRSPEPPLDFTQRGAALFVASLVLEHGETAVAKMARADVLEAARRLRTASPHVWPAMRLGDFVRLVYRDKGKPEPRPTVGDMQGLVDKILAEAPMPFRPFVAPTLVPASA